jgi:murein L,D-transpeptidase YcbB/YkuD
MDKIIEPEVSDELIRGVQKQMGIVSDGILGPETMHNIKELQFVCDVEVTGELN